MIGRDETAGTAYAGNGIAVRLNQVDVWNRLCQGKKVARVGRGY